MIRKLYILLLVTGMGLAGCCGGNKAETWRMMEFMLNQL